METGERDIAWATERMNAGQYVGGEPKSSGQGVEALKDIVFGAVCTNTFTTTLAGDLSEMFLY